MDTSFILFYVVGIAAVFAVGILTYIISRYFKRTIPRWVFYVMIVLSGYIFFAQYFKYQSLRFYVDFSHWAQIIYAITKTGLPHSLNVELIIPGMLNYFSVHFTPFIYLFAAIFKFLPYAETILGLNFLLMVSSIIPLYKLAVRTEYGKRFGLFMATLLLWYPTFQYITLYEFEMLRFSIPILLWMLYFWEARKTLLFFMFVLLAVLVREEVGLTIFMFGLYIMFTQKEKIKGLATAMFGLGAFVLITQVFMPAFSNAEQFQHIAGGIFTAFGKTPLEIIKGFVLHPALAADFVLNPMKLANIFMLFLPLLLIPFLAPTVLLSVLGNIGLNLLSNVSVHTSYMLYYLAPSIPFIFYAFIKAWPRFIRWLPSPSPLPEGEGGRRPGEGALMIAVLSGLLVSNIFFGPSPISLQFWNRDLRPAPFRTQDFHYSAYNVTDHHKQLEQLVDLIPDGAIVSTQQFILPRLFKKRGGMVFPQLKSKNGAMQADYVLIDKTNNNLHPESPAYISEEDFNRVAQNNLEWRLIKASAGYELYKKIL